MTKTERRNILTHLPVEVLKNNHPRDYPGEILRIISLATAGASGLHRVLQDQRDQNTYQLLRDGASFLDRVSEDIEIYENGVPVYTSDKRIYYDPRPILQNFAAYAINTGDKKFQEEQLHLTARRMQEATVQLKDLLKNLVDPNNNPLTQDKDELRETFTTYLQITDSYFDSLCH